MSKIDHAYEKDGYIYYSNIADDHRLYRLNLSTGENKRLTKSRAQYIVGLGEWIFSATIQRVHTLQEYALMVQMNPLSIGKRLVTYWLKMVI